MVLLVSMKEIAGRGTDDGQYRGSNARDLALLILAASESAPPAFRSWPRASFRAHPARGLAKD
jgi:hypothetical protein